MMTELSTVIHKLSTSYPPKNWLEKSKLVVSVSDRGGNLRLGGDVIEDLTPLDQRGYHKRNTHAPVGRQIMKEHQYIVYAENK